MSKPTQAQIEAAKQILYQMVVLTGDSAWTMDDVANKVLAAAEVGEPTVEQIEARWERKFQDAIELLEKMVKDAIKKQKKKCR